MRLKSRHPTHSVHAPCNAKEHRCLSWWPRLPGCSPKRHPVSTLPPLIMTSRHWLPVTFWVQCKVLPLTYKALNDLAPFTCTTAPSSDLVPRAVVADKCAAPRLRNASPSPVAREGSSLALFMSISPDLHFPSTTRGFWTLEY